MEHLLDRKPSQLSGGQRQRVAMGRALARDPQLFLFDEPLSNLDAKLRVEMRTEIKLLHERLKATIVYVTHDQIEAMTLGDSIAVMKDGEIRQFGSPQEIYDKPADLFVAGFIGSPSMNFIRTEAVEHLGGIGVRLQTAEETFVLPVHDAEKALRPWIGRELILGIRPGTDHRQRQQPAFRPQRPQAHLQGGVGGADRAGYAGCSSASTAKSRAAACAPSRRPRPTSRWNWRSIFRRRFSSTRKPRNASPEVARPAHAIRARAGCAYRVDWGGCSGT